MAFLGYEFANLSKEQTAARRVSLDRHAFIAQMSQVLVFLTLIVLKYSSTLLTRWFAADTEAAPSSPQKKYLAEGREKSVLANAAKRWRILRWKLNGEVAIGYGTWGQWIGGLLWTVWLAVLSFQGTAPDYMHFTKRFGLIAASQLPLHYLLAVKSPWSPIQLLLRTSHENLNPVHQVLGRIVMIFMFLHAACYVNFFLVTGFWVNRFKNLDVILGLTSISLVAVIALSASDFLRRRNYHLFFAIHAIAPIVLLALLYFHVRYIRVYVLESLAFAILNIITRLLSRQEASASVIAIKDTTLVRISAPSSASKANWAPGTHVYVRQSSGVNSYTSTNPFTISSLPTAKDRQLVLVARVLRGNTQKLARISQAEHNDAQDGATSITLNFEGPYGHSTYLPDLTKFERILFVAGGVGATYILPLWQYSQELRAAKSSKYQDIKLVWSVKQPEDAAWATTTIAETRQHTMHSDERELYITSVKTSLGDEQTAVEMSDRSDSTKLKSNMNDIGVTVHSNRPDFRQIVDESVSGNSGHIAIFVCGPASMTAALRKHVGRWILKGRDIYWHAEEFGL